MLNCQLMTPYAFPFPAMTCAAKRFAHRIALAGALILDCSDTGLRYPHDVVGATSRFSNRSSDLRTQASACHISCRRYAPSDEAIATAFAMS